MFHDTRCHLEKTHLKSNEFKLSVEVAGEEQKRSIKGPRRTPAMADTHLTSQEDSHSLVTARCFVKSYMQVTLLVEKIVTWMYLENSKPDKSISRTSRLRRQRFFHRKKAHCRGEVVSWSASG